MQANKWKQPMNQNKPIDTKINSDQEILKKKPHFHSCLLVAINLW